MELINLGRIALNLRSENGGNWSATEAYERLDVIRHEGTAYGCLEDNSGVEPPHATYWVPLVLDGQTPEHEWDGNSIRFKNPDGTWGAWVELAAGITETELGNRVYSEQNYVVSAETVTASIDKLDTNLKDAKDDIGNLATLNTTQKTSLVAAINEALETGGGGLIAGYFDTLSDLNAAYPTGDAGAYVVLENGEWYAWNSGTSTWESQGSYLPNLTYDNSESTLTATTYQTAIDELDEKRGDNDLLETEVKTNIVSAINEVNTKAMNASGKVISEFYDTLEDLEEAHPVGDAQIYVVLEDGQWYEWSNIETAWEAGGKYIPPANAHLTFNVMDFGAIGDGIVDDAPAIQATIEAAQANGGGRVFFPQPPNYYNVEQTIRIEIYKKEVSEIAGFHSSTAEFEGTPGTEVGQVRCVGASSPWSRGEWYEWDGTNWVQGPTGYQVLGTRVVLKDYSGITLQGESLGLHRTTKGTRIMAGNIPPDEDGYSHLFSIKGIPGHPGAGIANIPVDAFTIQDLCFRGVYDQTLYPNQHQQDAIYGAGLYFNTIEQLGVLNCRVDATNGPGVWIENSLDCCFTNMLVEECAVGFYISRGNHTHIHNITTCINRGAGMIVTDDTLDPYGTNYGTHGLIITGSNFRNNNRNNVDNDTPENRRNANGLYMENAHNCIISGCHFADDYAGDYLTETWGIQMQRQGIYLEEGNLSMTLPIANSSTNTRAHVTRASTSNVIAGNFSGGNKVKANGGVINKAFGTSMGRMMLTGEEYMSVGIDAPNWTAGENYQVGDYVDRFEIIYRCILGHTSAAENAPVNITYWVAVSDRGRFTTIGAAVDYFANKSASRQNNETSKGWISILPEYVIDERVKVSALNLGHVSIIHHNSHGFDKNYRIVKRSGHLLDTIEDDPDAWKSLAEGEYFAFLVGEKGATLPSLHTKIVCSDFDYNGNPFPEPVADFSHYITGCNLSQGSKLSVEVGDLALFPERFGFQGFDGAGVRVNSGSLLSAPTADFSNNGIGVDIIGSTANLITTTIDDCGTNNTGRVGLPPLGTWPFQGIGVRLLAGSQADLTNAQVLGATYISVNCGQLSKANLNEGNFRKTLGADSTQDVVIYGGGTVALYGAQGGCNVTEENGYNIQTNLGVAYRIDEGGGGETVEWADIINKPSAINKISESAGGDPLWDGGPWPGGSGGTDGDQVELQVTATHIQWKYSEDTIWMNLIALSELTGDTGAPGADGDQVEMRTNVSHIQWKLSEAATWNDLIALSELEGPTGPSGADGADGADGVGIPLGGDTGQVLKKNSTTDHDVIWADESGSGGADGREVELQTTATHIQWRYVGESTWTDLIALSELEGPTGPAGADGSDGDQVQLQVSATHIQWKLSTAAEWTNLIALSEIEGADGAAGEGVPTGGTAGQVLTKASATNYDTEWTTPSGGAGGESYRSATVIIAANDAKQSSKDAADYVCDGISDNDQITTAITTLSTLGGGRIVLSEGTFNIAATIFLNTPNIVLQGQGRHLTLLQRTASTNFIALDASNLTIQDLGLNGNDDATIGVYQYWGPPHTNITIRDVLFEDFGNTSGAGNGGAPIHITNCNDVRMENLRMINCQTAENIKLESIIRLNILNSHIQGTANGLQCLINATGITNGNVKDCHFEVTNETNAALLFGGVRNKISGNTFIGATTAIKVGGYFNLTTGNIIQGATTAYIENTGYAAGNANCLISNNIIEGGGVVTLTTSSNIFTQGIPPAV